MERATRKARKNKFIPNSKVDFYPSVVHEFRDDSVGAKLLDRVALNHLLPTVQKGEENKIATESEISAIGSRLMTTRSVLPMLGASHLS